MKKIILLLLLSNVAFAGSLVVEDARVRLMPPGQKTTAAFMKLTNKTNKAVKIVSAKSKVSKKTELHTHVKEGGMMKMREIPAILVEGNSSTILQPGGLHIMLIGLKNTLKLDQMVDIEITLDDGTKQMLKVPVKKMMPMKHKHHNH